MVQTLAGKKKGRFEKIRAAHQAGVFNDPRLVTHVLTALGVLAKQDKTKTRDAAAEDAQICDYLATEIIPGYDLGAWPLLRASYQGNSQADALRLRAMNLISPLQTRPLIEKAINGTSLIVADSALNCLKGRDDAADLVLDLLHRPARIPFRESLLQVLASLNDERTAAKVIEHFVYLRNLPESQAKMLGSSPHPSIHRYIMSEVRKRWACVVERLQLDRTDQTPISRTYNEQSFFEEPARHLIPWLHAALYIPDDSYSEFLLECLNRPDVMRAVSEQYRIFKVAGWIEGAASGGRTPELAQWWLAHREETQNIDAVFYAAVKTWTPEEVYDRLSPLYFKKMDQSTPNAYSRSEKLGHRVAYLSRALRDPEIWEKEKYAWKERPAPPDPRWVDAAIQMGDFAALRNLATPGDPRIIAFVNRRLKPELPKPSDQRNASFSDLLTLAAIVQHPMALRFLIRAMRTSLKCEDDRYLVLRWIYHIVPMFPKEAVAKLQPLVKKMDDEVADEFVDVLDKMLTGKPFKRS